MKRVNALTRVLYHLRFDAHLDRWWGPDRITILAYHRILDPSDSRIPYYRTNISASPEMFARQMQYVAEHFNVIDLGSLEAFVLFGRPLPPRPLLITFDDGYLDNYTHAFPVLRSHGFPAIIFLVTSKMDDPRPLWWDECAYYFSKTTKHEADLPFLGGSELSTPDVRASACEVIVHSLKEVSEGRRQALVRQIQVELDVATPPQDPDLFVSWNQARELVTNGIACQAHTRSHPILTRVQHTEMREQIVSSRTRIELETGKTVTAFAYPNGMVNDYDTSVLNVLRTEGFNMAFTLAPGPMLPHAVRKQPLEIARVYLSYQDNFETFVMKLMGLPILRSRAHQLWSIANRV